MFKIKGFLVSESLLLFQLYYNKVVKNKKP